MTDQIERKTIHTQSVASAMQMMGNDGQDAPRIFNWNVNPADFNLIQQIVQRAVHMFQATNITATNPQGQTGRLVIGDKGMTLTMDLVCIHLNHAPLRLYSMLMCGGSDFIEEISKISLCWNRKEGKMLDGVKLKFTEEK